MSGSPALEPTFQWNRFANDLAFTFEASANLQAWNPVGAIVLDSTALDSTTA